MHDCIRIFSLHRQVLQPVHRCPDHCTRAGGPELLRQFPTLLHHGQQVPADCQEDGTSCNLPWEGEIYWESVGLWGWARTDVIPFHACLLSATTVLLHLGLFSPLYEYKTEGALKFSHFGPSVWNSLSLRVGNVATIDNFEPAPITHLFSLGKSG